MGNNNISRHLIRTTTSAAAAAAGLAVVLAATPAQAMRAPDPVTDNPARTVLIVPARPASNGIEPGQVAGGAAAGLLLAGVGAAAARTRRRVRQHRMVTS